MKKIFSGVIVVIIAIIVCEISLRKIWGFCDAPLYVASNKYEYIYAPNQHRVRFGHHIDINQYSMRSAKVSKTKIHILGLGDSVLDGGSPTDQSDLATTLVSNELGIQMLHIAAGSWGPDNCAAYLREKGTFNAKAMILVVSSHDAHDNMDFTPVVGIHPSYPLTEYKSAICELFDRYLIPRLKGKLIKSKNKDLDPDEVVLLGIHKNGKIFNPGFNQLKLMADSLHIPFLIYLHPEQCELRQHQYNSQGKEIIQWAKNNHVSLTLGLDDSTIDSSCYRDGIHFNAKGQRKLANSFEQMIKRYNLL